jgi:hypothetical protein
MELCQSPGWVLDCGEGDAPDGSCAGFQGQWSQGTALNLMPMTPHLGSASCHQQAYEWEEDGAHQHKSVCLHHYGCVKSSM